MQWDKFNSLFISPTELWGKPSLRSTCAYWWLLEGLDRWVFWSLDSVLNSFVSVQVPVILRRLFSYAYSNLMTSILNNQVPPTTTNLHMLSITQSQHDFSLLIQLPQSNPIFDVQTLFPHRNNRFCKPMLPRIKPTLVFYRFGSEPGAFFRHHHLVFGEHH